MGNSMSMPIILLALNNNKSNQRNSKMFEINAEIQMIGQR